MSLPNMFCSIPLNKLIGNLVGPLKSHLTSVCCGDNDFRVNFALAVLNTDLNPAIGKVNINVQDLGRVIVNLINNAFYAVQEKAKTAGENYIPEVLLKTGIVQQSNGEYFFIRIKDNGIGIPEKIKQKIFQPFFTTKPTGEGTGLGLSLSFDIIRAHGGQLQVISQEGLGSEFEIQLPV